MDLSIDDRIGGVLVPVFAIRGKGDLGIGDTAGVREFVEWAASAGFRMVKILPINETGGDHSPYNAISSVALDPTTIRTAPDALEDLGADEYEAAIGEWKDEHPETVDYPAVKALKRRLLELAFANFNRKHIRPRTSRFREFSKFADANARWLNDYCLFRVLMDENGGTEQWTVWREEHRTAASGRRWMESRGAQKVQTLRRRIRYFTYVQWQAFRQWQQVKAFANAKGVALMGDIPFGVSYYGADVWAQPHLFRAKWCGGTPPDRIFKHDAFVQKWGQNWGIPLYNWDAMRGEDFRWWRQRVRGVREFFDLFRIDHVLGFYRIYGFPWRPEENATYLPLSEESAGQRTGGALPGFQPRPDDTPENKDRNRREGEEYLRVIVAEAGAGRVIGEDLGDVPDYVRPSLTALGIAGYKIPAWEKRDDGTLIPGNEYQRLSLATYGTHDHEPLRAMWERMASEASSDENARRELANLWRYARRQGEPPRTFTSELHEALLDSLFRCNSWIAVLMITDVFGRAERFNLPGVAGSGNWTQRLHSAVAELGSGPMTGRTRELLRAAKRVN